MLNMSNLDDDTKILHDGGDLNNLATIEVDQALDNNNNNNNENDTKIDVENGTGNGDIKIDVENGTGNGDVDDTYVSIRIIEDQKRKYLNSRYPFKSTEESKADHDDLRNDLNYSSMHEHRYPYNLTDHILTELQHPLHNNQVDRLEMIIYSRMNGMYVNQLNQLHIVQRDLFPFLRKCAMALFLFDEDFVLICKPSYGLFVQGEYYYDSMMKDLPPPKYCTYKEFNRLVYGCYYYDMRQYATNFYDYLQKRNISMRRSQLLYD